MLLGAQGDAFPYLLMYLMLKICQGLSALGRRIIRRLRCWIFWRGKCTLTSISQNLPHSGTLRSLFSLSISFYFSPYWPALDHGMQLPGWIHFPDNLEHFQLTLRASFLLWMRKHHLLVLLVEVLFCRGKKKIAAKAIKVARNTCMSYVSPDSARALGQCVSFSDGN